MKPFRAIFALALAAALLLPLAGCRREAEPAAPDTMACAYFDLAVHDDAAPLRSALGQELSEESIRAAFLPPHYYDGAADQLAGEFSSMGITVSDADSQLLADTVFTLMRKINFSARVKDIDGEKGTAAVTVQISTFPAGAFTNAATAAVADMELSEFLSDDLDAVFSKLIHLIADTVSQLQPTGETQSIDLPFSLQTLEIDGQSIRVWCPEDGDAFMQAISDLAVGF